MSELIYLPVVVHDLEGNERELVVVKSAKGLFFPINTIATAIGLDPWGQIRKLQTDDEIKDSLEEYKMPTQGRGMRDQWTIEHESVGLWLLQISSGKVKPEVRQKLRQFRLQIKQIARDILFGEVSLKRETVQERLNSQDVEIHGVQQVVQSLEKQLGALYGAIATAGIEEDGISGIMTCPHCQRKFRFAFAEVQTAAESTEHIITMSDYKDK